MENQEPPRARDILCELGSRPIHVALEQAAELSVHAQLVDEWWGGTGHTVDYFPSNMCSAACPQTGRRSFELCSRHFVQLRFKEGTAYFEHSRFASDMHATVALARRGQKTPAVVVSLHEQLLFSSSARLVRLALTQWTHDDKFCLWSPHSCSASAIHRGDRLWLCCFCVDSGRRLLFSFSHPTDVLVAAQVSALQTSASVKLPLKRPPMQCHVLSPGIVCELPGSVVIFRLQLRYGPHSPST